MLLPKHSSFASIKQESLTFMAEEQEEKEGTDWAELFGHAVRFMILCWSFAMMTLGYMDKIRNDGAFLAGLTSGVLGSYGISVNKKKPTNAAKIVDNKDTNVGIK